MLVRLLLLMLLGCSFAIGVARAEEFNPPGLARDANAYRGSLTARYPAGGTPAARAAAEARTAAARAANDWDGVAAGLEARVALGQVTADHWLELARAQLHRTPPNARHALDAGWQAFNLAETGPAQVPSLLVMAEALHLLGREAQQVEALEAVVEREPDDAGYKRQLAEARRAAGMLVRKVRTEAEADPPRACISFTVPPRRDGSLNPPDWVRLDPPRPDAAVTREGDQLCVSGLPAGQTTTVILRQGLPGEQGLTLAKAVSLPIAIPNREPSLGFDTRLFVLPRGQTPAVTLTTVNLSAVSLKLIRLSDRSIAALLRDYQLGQAVSSWSADNLGETAGSVVWEGKADIPKWQTNQPARTALPVPPPLETAGPGIYALIAGPGDGTTGDITSAVQIILRTDLAPTVWRGADGLTVQIRDYSNAALRAGVRVVLLARNNDVLAEATTDAEGVARFAAPLLAGSGSLAAASIQAFAPKQGDAPQDFATLDLNTAAFDLSDRGVSGMPHPGPLDAYVWLDRGIYRPGETVRVMALLRDSAGLPADVPAQVTVRRPNGQVFLRTTPARAADASLYLPVKLSAGAASGTWTIDIAADPKTAPIGHAEFRVDAFVPDRMAVDFGTLPKRLAAGVESDLPITARYLYGAPGADLSGKASLRLIADPTPFPALDGYRVGLAGESYAPDSRDLDLPDTDAKGETHLAITLGRLPDVSFALQAEINVSINDPSGHASRATTTLKVRPANKLIGIKPAFADDAVDAGAPAGFTLRAVNQDGEPVAMKATLRLVRERPDWRMVMHGRLARYEVVWRDEPLETRTVELPPGGLTQVYPKLNFGRYRIEVAEQGGMALASYRFRAGWTSSDNPDVPDRVDVSADRRSVPAGQNVRIHIAAPFAGKATLLVLTNKVLSLRDIAVAEGGTDVEVPVTTAWGPGAYVAVHVFRGGDVAGKRPARAIGLTWVGVDPAARTLAVEIATPDKAGPRAPLDVPVKVTPGAWVTLAAVDEGILRLTRFTSPDPRPHFLGRRRLGLDIRDDWGRLIPPAEGETALLRQGGDEGSFALPDIPQRTVTLFSPPVQAGPDGIAHVKLDIPDFNGQVRLMAVAWSGSRLGAAHQDITIRDPLVVEELLPRFLAPGDESRLAVLLHNLDLPKGEAAVAITTSGPLAIDGAARLAAELAPGQQALPATRLRATGAGRGVIHLAVTGPGGFTLQRDTAITIRPARGRVTFVSGGELAPGASVRLDPGLGRFLAGTGAAVATIGAPVRYDAAALVQALADYPLSCLEQTASRGLPLALLPDGAIAGPDRAGRLQAAVASVLDRQRYDGGFALWSANGEAEPWLSAYAMEFLLRARHAGAAIPQQAVDDGIKFLADATDGGGDGQRWMVSQAYRLYVLALAGHGRPGAARVLASQIDDIPTPLARAQLGAALALAHDRPRAEAAFAAALDAPARGWWSYDYGTALRDQAAIAVLLRESRLLPDRLRALVAKLPGADLDPHLISTQEEAWTAAAAAVLGRDGKPAHVSLDGRVTLSAPTITLALGHAQELRNTGAAAVWQSVSASGVPATPLPAQRAGMRVKRQFFNLDGSTLNLDQLHQNTVFVLLVEGRAEDGQPHRATVMQGLPAGWEVAARFNAGEVPGLSWLGKLSETEAQPAADDRFVAVLNLEADHPDFRVAVRLRAVTPGVFELPGAELADMYRPGIFARQNTGRITVLPP